MNTNWHPRDANLGGSVLVACLAMTAALGVLAAWFRDDYLARGFLLFCVASALKTWSYLDLRAMRARMVREWEP